MLDADTRAALTEHLKLLRRPVRILFSVGNEEAEQLARQVAELSALLTAEPGASEDLEIVGEHPGPRFRGVPGGHEFTSFVLGVLHAGGHPAKEGAVAMREAAEHINRSGARPEFVTYYSQTCLNCPQVVQALNLLSVMTPNVTVTAIDIQVARDEVEKHGISAVPAIYLDGEPLSVGRVDAETLAAKISEKIPVHGASGSPASNSPDGTGKTLDLLVVGGGPAGTAAAVYAARKGLSVAVLSETWGGQLLDTEGIENLITAGRTTGRALAAQLRENLEVNQITCIRGRAERLEPGEQRRWGVVTTTGTHQADAVLLAPGASWRTLGVPGEEHYRNRGVTFCPHCDGPLFRDKDVAVIGGGNSGVEAAIDLSGVAKTVTVVEYADSCRADQVLLDTLSRRPNTQILTGMETTEVLGDGTKVTGLRIRNRGTGQLRDLDLDGVFVQIGLVPNTGWLDGVVKTNARGELVTDGQGRTDVAGVYAAGDASDGVRKQITTAVGGGAAAAITMFEDRSLRS